MTHRSSLTLEQSKPIQGTQKKKTKKQTNTRIAAELRDPNDPQESSKARACESRSLDDPGEPINDGAESFYQKITDTLTAAEGKGLYSGPRTW